MASRGMGAIRPSKVPKGIKKHRRDNTDFTEYAAGGKVKKKVAYCDACDRTANKCICGNY